MATNLEDRVAIVTGAGRGIGRAVALGLQAEGARIVVNDIGRDEQGEPSAERVAREIRDAGGEAIASVESITDYAAAGRIVGAAVEAFGRVDVLVNNAGVSARGSILEIDDAEFERVSASHVAGCFNCTSHAVKPMVEGGWGRIVNLVSRTGITGLPGSIAYAMGKGAVFGLTNGASRELADHGITVNAICPSSTRTVMVEDAIEVLRKEGPEGQARADSLLAQMQTPEEVAQPIVALCTEAAGAINGQTFLVEHDRIGLFQPLTVTQTIVREPGWGANDLAGALAGLELPALTDAYG